MLPDDNVAQGRGTGSSRPRLSRTTWAHSTVSIGFDRALRGGVPVSGERVDRATERRRVLRALARDEADADSSDAGERGTPESPPVVAAGDAPDWESTSGASRHASPDGGRERTLGTTGGPDVEQPSIVAADASWECAGCERTFPVEPAACPDCGATRFERGTR